MEIKPKYAHGGGATIIFNVLGIIFAICLIGSIIRISFGESSITFTTFLEYISNVPTIEIDYFILGEITNDWGIFNIFKDLFNNISAFISFLAWFGINAVNGLGYVFYFVRFIFV